jgi:hypothetical protein
MKQFCFFFHLWAETKNYHIGKKMKTIEVHIDEHFEEFVKKMIAAGNMRMKVILSARHLPCWRRKRG